MGLTDVAKEILSISDKLDRIHELVGPENLIPRLVWLRDATGCTFVEAVDLLLEIETRRKEKRDGRHRD